MRVITNNITGAYKKRRMLVRGLLPFFLFIIILAVPGFAFAYLGEDTINNAILSIGRAFFSAGYWFVEMAVGYTTKVVSNTGVAESWKLVRNLSLEIFGIIILIIAFMNLLKIQIQTWGVNRMIPKMFLAVFLIVFSKFLCISLINFSHAIVGTLIGGPSGTSGFFSSFSGLGKSLEALKGDNISTAMAFVVLLISIISFFVFLVLAIALFFRAAFLAFLIIVSPFAFAMIVLPWTEKYLQEWTKNFIKWVFFFPLCILILWVGMSMVGTTAPDTTTTTFSVTGGTSDATNSFLGDWSVMILAFLTIPLSIWFPLKMLGAVGQGIQDRISGKKGIAGMPFDPKAARARWDKRSGRIAKKKEQRLGSSLGAVGRARVPFTNASLQRLGTIGGKDGNMNWLGKAALGHDNMYAPDKATRQMGAARLATLRKNNPDISDGDILKAAIGNFDGITNKKTRKKLERFTKREGRNATGIFQQHFDNQGKTRLSRAIVTNAERQRLKKGRYGSLSMAEKVQKSQGKEKAASTIKEAIKDTGVDVGGDK